MPWVCHEPAIPSLCLGSAKGKTRVKQGSNRVLQCSPLSAMPNTGFAVYYGFCRAPFLKSIIFDLIGSQWKLLIQNEQHSIKQVKSERPMHPPKLLFRWPQFQAMASYLYYFGFIVFIRLQTIS